MTDIVKIGEQPLKLILTRHGLDRVAKASADPSLNLHITKIKFGSGTKEDHDYYVPSESQPELQSPIPEADFYIYKKELLEDKLTISFYTIVPETIGGFDIREVGLFETVDGEDKLFAVGTCQPFVKPEAADNYFIAIDYYIFLKAADLNKVFDQIVLDPEHAIITDADLEELMRTFLFSNANLINQIGNNSRIIGYNRATQLYEKIAANKTSYSYITLYKNFNSLLDIASPNSVFSFWAFDYSRRLEAANSIVDLSQNANFLSTTIPVASIEQVYEGFMSTFKMDKANFYLDAGVPVRLYNDKTNQDIPFVIAFALNPLPLAEGAEGRTLLAKSDYATGSHTFEFNELANGAIQVKLFTDANNYLVFISNEGACPQRPHSLVLSYDPEAREFTAYVNSDKIPMIIDTEASKGDYTHMQETPGTLYAFKGQPSYTMYADPAENPTEICYEDGINYPIEEDSIWQINDGKLYYEGNEAVMNTNPLTRTLYKWTYTDSELNEYSIYTLFAPVEDPQNPGESKIPEEIENVEFYEIMDDKWVSYEGSSFYTANGYVCYLEDTNHAKGNGSTSKDIYAWTYQFPAAYIYTNSTTNPTRLYEFTEDKAVYTGDEWQIIDQKIFYMDQEATYDPNPPVSWDSSNERYTDLASYIIGNAGEIKNPINSEVGIITIIKDKIEEEKVRALSLLLCATMGVNPYMGI